MDLDIVAANAQTDALAFFEQHAVSGRAVLLGTANQPVLWLFRINQRLALTDDSESPHFPIEVEPTTPVRDVLTCGLSIMWTKRPRVGRPRKETR